MGATRASRVPFPSAPDPEAQQADRPSPGPGPGGQAEQRSQEQREGHDADIERHLVPDAEDGPPGAVTPRADFSVFSTRRHSIPVEHGVTDRWM